MLETRLISAMKWSKDMMSNPPADGTLDQIVSTAKGLGATHVEIGCPFGLPNSGSEMKRWAGRIHSAGLLATYRCADVHMEGLYDFPKAVGRARKPQQYYIDEAVTFIKADPAIFQAGDEWAIFPERTEGIWRNATSWIGPNDPATYADFFVTLASESSAAFAAIGKDVQTGLSANNGSELLSGWMSKAVSDQCGYVCVDHYVENNPLKLVRDLRAMSAKYGKPIYLQESAPSLFCAPTNIELYFRGLSDLRRDGILARFGYWGLWAGTPEGCINPDFSLNEIGVALQAFFIPAPESQT